VIFDDLVEQRVALEGATRVGFPCSSLAFSLLTVWESKRNFLDEAALSAQVLNYTRDVEAFLRTSKRMGLTHKPRTVVEVMLLNHEQRECQLKAIEGIEDVLRLQVSCSFFSSLWLRV
jgi:hypothetical protein